MDGSGQCFTNNLLELFLFGSGFALGICLIRVILCKFVLKYILLYATPNGRNGKLSQNKNRLTHVVDTFWCACFYVCSALIGIGSLILKEWLWNHTTFWKDFPHEPQDTNSIKLYYLIGLGFYLQALVSLLFFEVKLKDFYVMLIHHIATIILITLSYYVGFVRIGSVVLLLHDIVDVFLYISKLVNSVGLTTVSLFTGFFLVASYGLCRLVWFPAVILFAAFPKYPTISYHYLLWISWRGSENADVQSASANTSIDAFHPPQFSFNACGICAFGVCVSPYWICIGFLSLLVCLHVYWYFLLVKVAFRNIRTCGKAGDIREDEEV